MRKTLVTIMLVHVVLTAFIGTNTASAAEQPFSGTENTQQCSANSKAEIAAGDQEITNVLLATALESEEFALFQEELEHENESAANAENRLQVEIAESYSYKIGKNFILYIPMSGGTDHSFYGMQFDESLSIIGTMAGLFRLNAQENVAFYYQINNQTIADLEITQEGDILGGQVFDLEGNEQNLYELNGEDGWWNCMNSCLSDMGVPLYLINGLALVCAAACVVTAGLACGICLSVALGAFSGVGVFCLGACEDGQW